MDVRKDYAAEVRSTLVFKRATGRRQVDISSKRCHKLDLSQEKVPFCYKFESKESKRKVRGC